MPANILNLTSYAVLSVDNTDHDYHIKAEVKEAPKRCYECHSSNVVGFGRREHLVKDLPIHGKRVGIYLNIRRMKCNECSKTFSERLPEVDERRAAERVMEEFALCSPAARDYDASKNYGSDISTLARLIDEGKL